MVRTAGFHPVNRSSILRIATIKNIMREKSEYKILIHLKDFDNTIADFYKWSAKAYPAMFNSLHQTTNIPLKIIISEARHIYDQKGTLEYPLLVQNLPCLKHRSDLQKLMYLAKDTFSKAKRQHLSLIPGVKEELLELNKQGIPTYIFSDGPIIHICKRIMRLKIDKLILIIVRLKT